MRDLEENLNDYINEEISFLTYRERRAEYINNFVGSEYRPDVTIPLRSSTQRDVQKKIVEKTDNSTSADSLQSFDQEPSTHTIKQISILGFLIVVATATWYLSTEKPDSKPVLVQSADQPEVIAKKEKKTNNKNKEFIINFVKRDQWNSDTLSEFLVKWQELPRLSRKQMKQSQSFIRLKNSLRLRILEQKALQNVENKTAERQENLLIWFASQLTVTIK